MDLNRLLKVHANLIFRADGFDESGAYMVIDNYRLHLRNDDFLLVNGLSLSEVWPLVDDVRDC